MKISDHYHPPAIGRTRNPVSRFLMPALFVVLAGLQIVHAQNKALTNIWTVAPGAASHPFMINDDRTRGMAYNPTTGHVLVPSRSPAAAPTNSIFILDSANGAILGKLAFDPVLMTGGNFVVSMIGVTTDGVIYVANLSTETTNAASPFRLYRYANESAQPTLAYTGDPSFAHPGATGANIRRFGDSMAVRGAGASTQILLGSFNQSYLAVLTTADGVNFTATKITTDGSTGDTRWGLAWGVGDTFWTKQTGQNLKRYSLNIAAGTATVSASVPLPAAPGSTNTAGGPIWVDTANNLLALLDANNHKLRVYDISNPSAPVQTDVTKDMPAANANGNFVGSVYIGNGKFFALETANGIQAYTLHDTVFSPTLIGSLSAPNLWEGANWTFAASAWGTALTYQWRFEGNDLPGQTGSTLTFNALTLANEGYYSFVAANSAGSVTSAPAFLDITPGYASGQVTNSWNIAPNTRPYLTSGYKEYGVAINPVNNNVIVLTRQNPTNMLVVLDPLTGAEKHYIDYSGLLPFTGGYNKVDVADDGTIYLCNLSTDTLGSNPFRIDGLSDDNQTPASAGRLLFSGDPGNGLTSPNVNWGGTMAVRGAGTNTQILLGSGAYNQSSTTVAILRTDSSGFFTSTAITVTGAPDKLGRLGLDWGPGTNTFWAKSPGSLVLVEFDLETATGFAKKIYPTTGNRSVPYSVTGISYDPVSKLLAGLQNGSPPSPVSVPVFDVSDVEAGPLWADQELFTTYNADVEYAANVDFANGYLVALGLNNGLKMFRIDPSFSSSLPIIVTHPADGEVFVGTSPTISVVADANAPLSYQWFHNGTLLSGATSSSLTLSDIQETQAGEYFARVSTSGGYRDSFAATLDVIPVYNTAQMSNIWSVLPGTRPYLNTYYYEYGMAFNPVNSNLLVASCIKTNTENPTIIGVIDALTGAHKHTLDVSQVNMDPAINRYVNKIGVADDGVVYVCNRTTQPGTYPFVIYRWADDQPTTLATVAFIGDPFATLYPNKNCGWTMDVRGAGVNTEILVTAYDTNVIAILKTTDGFNFTANEVLVEGAPVKFARLGVCFGAGNTIWAKAWVGDGGALRLVQYDLSAGTGTILRTYNMDLVAPEWTTVAYNDNLKFLAGISRDYQKNMQVYGVSDLDAGPLLLDQEVFPSYNPSIEANGALDFGGNTYLFGLNENNGIMAMLIDSTYKPAITSFKILSLTTEAGNAVITWESRNGAKYQVKSAETLGGAWGNLGSVITATGSTSSYTNAIGAGQKFYRVEALNN